MSRSYDVIIVGLGPAGASAAAALARGGARVLALDGARSRAKPCGGCLSRWAVAELAWLDPPAWVTAHPVRRLWLAAPGRPVGRFDTGRAGAYLVERYRLDRMLARRATEAGASVVAASARRLECRGTGFEVFTDRGRWRSDWLVGADGAASLVARRLGMVRSRFVYTALVEERAASRREVERFSGSVLLEVGAARGGYGWAFLRGGVLNLGLAGRGIGGRELFRRYQEFLARCGLGRPGRCRGAAIPCSDGTQRGLWQGRAVLVGDAAGLADPFLGEGIGQSVVSGRLAARAILREDLAGYEDDLRRELLTDARSARLLIRLVHLAPGWFQHLARRHPGSVDLAWQVLRGELGYGHLWAVMGRRLASRVPGLDLPWRGGYSK